MPVYIEVDRSNRFSMIVACSAFVPVLRGRRVGYEPIQMIGILHVYGGSTVYMVAITVWYDQMH